MFNFSWVTSYIFNKELIQNKETHNSQIAFPPVDDKTT